MTRDTRPGEEILGCLAHPCVLKRTVILWDGMGPGRGTLTVSTFLTTLESGMGPMMPRAWLPIDARWSLRESVARFSSLLSTLVVPVRPRSCPGPFFGEVNGSPTGTQTVQSVLQILPIYPVIPSFP